MFPWVTPYHLSHTGLAIIYLGPFLSSSSKQMSFICPCCPLVARHCSSAYCSNCPETTLPYIHAQLAYAQATWFCTQKRALFGRPPMYWSSAGTVDQVPSWHKSTVMAPTSLELCQTASGRNLERSCFFGWVGVRTELPIRQEEDPFLPFVELVCERSCLPYAGGTNHTHFAVHIAT